MDAILDYPQSGERFRGRTTIAAQRGGHPAERHFTVLRISGNVGERVHHHLRRRANLLSLHHGICSRVGSARDAVLRQHLQCTCVSGSTRRVDAGQAHRKGMIASFESVGAGGDW